MKPEGQFSAEVGKAHGANWHKWLGHLKGTKASGIELGTWMGESAEYMLTHFFDHPDSRYLCIDTFKGSEEHAIAGLDCSELEKTTRGRLERFSQAEIIVGMTNSVLRQLRPNSYDFAYVDAAHDAVNVLRDSVLAFDLLKKGGIIIWDDVEWQVMPSEIDRPKIAVHSFLRCYARQTEIISLGGYQVCARKTV